MGKNSAEGNSGFTLLEVLIAISLAGLIIAALAGSLFQSSNVQRLLGERLTANILGQGKLAELVHESETGLSGDFAAPYQKFKWRASEETIGDGGKKITLIVEWRDNHAFSRQTSFVGYRLPE